MADGFATPADASAFQRTCLAATTRDEVSAALDREMRRLGLSRYLIGEMASPVAPPRGVLLFNAYPITWMKHHLTQGYLYDDPALAWLRERRRPTVWNDPEFIAFWRPLHRQIMGEAGEFGLRQGFSALLPRVGVLPTSCHFSPDVRDLPMEAYKAGMNAAAVALETAKTLDREQAAGEAALTERERRCLQLVAQGKSDWAISEILGVSERSVHHAIERAKRRYGVASRVQAVIRAVVAGEIIVD